MHTHSRRNFLVSAFALRAALARAQSLTAPANLFDVQRIADGVYAAVARPAALVNCNAAIFENADDLLIVDSHSKPSAAAALLAQLRKEVSPKPVRYLVNTHFHWDHTQGNDALAKAAPAADIISSTATRSLIEEFGLKRLRERLNELPREIEQERKRAAAARTAEEKAYFERTAAESEAYLREMRGYRFELPTITFSDNLILHDRAHELHFAFRGRGHTAGDIVVYCPQKKVIATGDLAHQWLPFLGDGYPHEWPKTLRTVAGFEFGQAIGGHGEPLSGTGHILQMAEYIEELTGVVEKLKREGRSADQVAKSVSPEQLKSLASGGYGDTVSRSLRKHDSIEPAKTPAQILDEGVRENASAIYNALERS